MQRLPYREGESECRENSAQKDCSHCCFSWPLPVNADIQTFEYQHLRGVAMKNSNVSSPFVRSFLCTLILLLCTATAAFAQAGRGSISGLVTDPSGAIIPGAKVT